MVNTAKLLLSLLLIFTSLNTLLGQRLLQPIRSLSLVAAPALLERESAIQDLEVIAVEHPDTLIVNQIAQFSGYIKNSSDKRFETAINLNFDLDQLDNLGNVENTLGEDVDNRLQFPLISLAPGDSIYFATSFNIDPLEIDPNTIGVVIIWPEFRLISTSEEAEEQHYSIEQFFATGLNLDGHSDGTGKYANTAAVAKKNTIALNSLNNLQYYLMENNYNTVEFMLTTIDGKVILQQQQLPQLKTINNLMLNGNSKIAILNVLVQKPNAKLELVTIKLHNNTL